MRHAIEKSEMMQVARDSYPLWMRKRPSPGSNEYFRYVPNYVKSVHACDLVVMHRRLLPPESFAVVGPPPAMSSLWKMSYFYSVRTVISRDI